MIWWIPHPGPGLSISIGLLKESKGIDPTRTRIWEFIPLNKILNVCEIQIDAIHTFCVILDFLV